MHLHTGMRTSKHVHAHTCTLAGSHVCRCTHTHADAHLQKHTQAFTLSHHTLKCNGHRHVHTRPVTCTPLTPAPGPSSTQVTCSCTGPFLTSPAPPGASDALLSSPPPGLALSVFHPELGAPGEQPQQQLVGRKQASDN